MADTDDPEPPRAPHDAEYDLVVVGGGPAGEKGAVQAAYFGKRVALVERAVDPGGACVHTGTLPSKTLREASLFLAGHRHRELYGISVAVERCAAAPRLASRKDAVRAEEVARMRWNLERHHVELIHGYGRFRGPHELAVTRPDGSEILLRAKHFLVATGSSPFRPSNIDFEDPDIEDSDSVLELARVPASLTVIGAGVIGCEYATLFAELEVKVTLVEARAEILGFLDDELVRRLESAMRSKGMVLHFGDGHESVKRDERGIVTRLASGTEVVSEQLLFAAGRGGNTKNLGLQELGIEIDKRGYIKVDTDYQTAVPSIWAAGDCIGFPALASTSMEQARVAVCHAFGFDYKRSMDTLLPYGIYTIPEVSAVGLTEEDAEAQEREIVVGRAFYRDNARGKIIGDREGIVKLVFDKQTRKLIGCHCMGDRASELVHIGQTAIALGGTVDTFIELVFNFPTLSETFKYAAYDALSGFD
ncbi:MAG: Si-specific NAD(P)(+) transhydrogenase [Polyangiaceae bacterium]